MQTCDVAVIGAGIVGAACAYELASCGLRVAVVEPNAVAAGGTNLGYGSLSILDDLPGKFELTRYGTGLWAQLANWLPAECGYRRCGTVWVATQESQMANVIARCEILKRAGIEAEVLDAQQLAEAEPGLRADLAGGLLVADDACMRASRAAEFLFQLAVKKGAVQLRQSAAAIQEHAVALADGSILHAGAIVNAAGNGAEELTPELPVSYTRAHVLTVETQVECMRHHVAEMGAGGASEEKEAVRFEGRQDPAGEVWIGASQQVATATSSTQVEPKIVALILRRAIEMTPAIGNARPQRSWTGSWTTTADGLPLIGRLGGKEWLFAATAHDRFGATAALATAKLIGDEILLRIPKIDPMPYRADRFAGASA